MFSPSGVRGPGPAAWSNRVGESVRSMVGLYRLYWIPFTFRMLLIHIVKRDQMHHVLWYHILHIRNCIISIEAHQHIMSQFTSLLSGQEFVDLPKCARPRGLHAAAHGRQRWMDTNSACTKAASPSLWNNMINHWSAWVWPRSPIPKVPVNLRCSSSQIASCNIPADEIVGSCQLANVYAIVKINENLTKAWMLLSDSKVQRSMWQLALSSEPGASSC